MMILFVWMTLMINVCDAYSLYYPPTITISPDGCIYRYNMSSTRRKIPSCIFQHSNQNDVHVDHKREEEDQQNCQDTIRVRIWNALSSSKGEEVSLRELGSIVGERRFGDLKSHLVHVEKQAKTIGNKSKEWKKRRGLDEHTTKAKIQKRIGQKGMVYLKLR